MKTLQRFGGPLLFALLALTPARAQLTLQSIVTANAGLFSYSYNVSNQTSNDVSIITLSGLFNAADAVQNLTAPVGFLSFFDPGLSLVSFLESSDAFGAGETDGAFTFDSPYAPGVGSFEALDVTGSLLVGSVVVPTGLGAASAVPEPATTAAMGALALLGLVFHRKFIRSKPSVSTQS
jgi:hypothetical protein